MPWEPPDYAKPYSSGGTWEPPDYASPYKQEVSAPSPQGRGGLMGLWDYVNEPLTDIFSQSIGRAGNWLSDYSERPVGEVNDWLRKPAAYGGAYLQSLGGVVDELTNPLNLALTATTGGASYYAKAALAARNAGRISEAIELANKARALEAPGRVAAAGMVGQGGYKIATGETIDEQLAGGVEAALGGLGMRSLVRGTPTVDILPPTGVPRERLQLPRNAGPSVDAPPRFLAGEAGIADVQTPYRMDLSQGKLPPIEGTVLPREYGEISTLPPDLAARTGLTLGRNEGFQIPEQKLLGPGPRFMGMGNVLLDNQNPIDLSQFDLFSKPKTEPSKPDLAVPEDALFDDVSFARTETGKAKIGVDVKHAAGELTTGYSRPLQEIMVREGMQNAFDAVKSLGLLGQVKVGLLESRGSDPAKLMIEDNGRGMGPDELYTVYTDLHSSGKKNDINATGGKGVGKATYMLGGTHFEVKTVKLIDGKKIESTFSGTPDELMEGFDIKSREVPANTPTGTKFITQLKPDQAHYNMVMSLNNIMKYSRGLQTKVINQYYDTYNPKASKLLEIPEAFGGGGDKVLLTDEPLSNHSNMDLFIPSSAEIKGERSSLKVSVLTNGMHQFDYYMYLNEPAPGVPSNLVVDVKPKVEEGTPDYPFPVQRESFKDEVKSRVEQIIKDKIVSRLSNNRRMDLKALWDSMQPASQLGKTPTHRETVIFDSGDRLTKQERTQFEISPIVQDLRTATDVAIHRILESSGEKTWIDRVVRTGVILNSDLFGVHIPNPMGKGGPKSESAIFVNYFEHALKTTNPREAAANAVITNLHEVAHVEPSDAAPRDMPEMSMQDLQDPRVGKYLQSYIQHVIEATGGDISHQLSFVKRLGAIYAKTGTKNFLDLEDYITGIFTGGKLDGGYSPEFQELLHIYQESRGRAATTEDVLSGTGVKQANKKSGGTGDIPSPDRPDGNGITSEGIKPSRAKKTPKTPETERKKVIATDRLKKGLLEGLYARESQDEMYSVERARRAAMISKVKEGGREGYYKQLGMLSGPLPKFEDMGKKLTGKDVDELMDVITQSDLLPYQQINAKTGLMNLMSGRAPQRSEIKLLGQVFQDPELEQLMMLHGSLGYFPTTRSMVNQLINLPKALMSTLDFSATFMQGLPLIHKKEYWQAFAKMPRMFGDEKFYDGQNEWLETRPYAELGRESGLSLTNPKSEDLAAREENFITDIPYLVRPFNRAYTGFLNQLRANTFDHLIDNAIATKQPDIKDLAKRYADFINTATGRGSLGRLEKSAVELNAVLWSPRLMASRFKMLGWTLNQVNPNYYVNTPAPVRKEILKSLLATAGSSLMMLGLYKMAGGEVEDNPTSTNFGRAKFGNTTVNPTGGISQYVVGAMRLITGKSVSQTNREYDLNNPQSVFAPTRYDVIHDFFQGRMSPFAGFIASVLQGEKQAFPPQGLGKKLQPDSPIKARAVNLFVPMVANDMIELYAEDPSLMPLGIPAMFGHQVNVVPPRGTRSNLEGINLSMPSGR